MSDDTTPEIPANDATDNTAADMEFFERAHRLAVDKAYEMIADVDPDPAA